eukprot:58324_1
MNPVEDYLANYLFNFMKCSVIFQVPLILITPILQMLLLVNNYCIDTANESKNVSQIISVAETIALFLVPTCWWIFVWGIIYVFQKGDELQLSWMKKDNTGCFAAIRLYAITLIGSLLFIGLFIVDGLLVFHSFVVWGDSDIECDMTVMQTSCYWFSMVWLIHNIMIALGIFCCMLMNSQGA